MNIHITHLRQIANNERGMQLIEFIGLFPLVLFAIVFAWQMLLVGYTGIIASGAVNEAARAAATHEDVERSVRNASPGFDGRRNWRALGGYPCAGNQPVTLQVQLEAPHVSFPFIGSLGGYPKVARTATARCEPVPM